MKKTISWLVIAAFLTAGFSLVTIARADNNRPELEKISSPEMIKEFRVMKREGGSLYGIRLNSSSSMPAHPGLPGRLVPNSTSTSLTASSTSTFTTPTPGTASTVLEKIKAPEFIHEYEKIRKIGNALWGFLKVGHNKSDNQGTGHNVKSSERENQSVGSQAAYVVVTPDIAACVVTAINTKDQAVIAEVNTAAASLAAAISTRSTCQQAVVQSTSNQQSAVAGCAQAFQTSRQKINQIAQQAQKEAWTSYRTSLQACQASSSVVSTSTPATTAISSEEINIEDGGNSNLINTVTNNGSDN